MLTCVVAHIITAVMLVVENHKARPEKYVAKATLQGSFASRTMRYSGVILLLFIVFHIMHFTIQNIHPEFLHLETELKGTGTMHHVYDKLSALGNTSVHDVYSMVVIGFSAQFWYVPVFYIISMIVLCFHLMHGISSMFQSLGLRNDLWRWRLDKIALVVAVIVFIGFTSIPVACLTGMIEPLQELAAAH
jgi:succinate dehydrogenase / fumarate reductase cytochrome b subunit